MPNAIEIVGLTKHYPNFMLNNVSFSVPEGLCCGFVGPNGAGKTTTLKAMMGMVALDGGEIRLLGKSADDASVKEDIGVMFDQPYFQEDWTPLEIERGIRPFYKNWSTEEYRRYLARFELDPKKKFKELSRGMKMKLALAVHLSHEAKLLLLDEPTGGLDPVARDELLDIMQEYMINEERTIGYLTGACKPISGSLRRFSVCPSRRASARRRRPRPKIPRKLLAYRCEAVLRVRLFVRAMKRPQPIPGVSARASKRHWRKEAPQNLTITRKITYTLLHAYHKRP